MEKNYIHNRYEMTETSRFSEGDESIADFSVFNDSAKGKSPSAVTSFSGAFGASAASKSFSNSPFTSNTISSPRRQLFIEDQKAMAADTSNGASAVGEVPKEENANMDFPVESLKHAKEAVSEADKNKVVLSKNSGLFMYVDIHGHASKRGIFM